MTIIDAHAHLMDEPGYLEKLIATMDDCHIDKCCLSGLGEFFWCADNKDVKSAFCSYPDRIIGAVSIRPGHDKPEKIVQAYNDGFRMVKVSIPKVPYDDPACFELWNCALEYKMPVLFHTGIVTCKELPGESISSWNMHPMRIEPITREFPELGVIVAHLGIHWNDSAAELARMRPNVYVDLTGEPEGWRKRLDSEGAEKYLWWPGAFGKVIFGTDVHYNKISRILQDDINRLDKVGIDNDTREKIFSENILRLLGMEQ